MCGNPNLSNVSRRQFLTVAGSVAATSSIAVRRPTLTPPQTTTSHNVTVDITTNPISYTAGGHHAYRLPVSAGDKVTWTAKTTGPKHRLTILFLKETPLLDSSGNPVLAVHGSDTDESGSGIGGVIDSDASGTYEYYVAVFDDRTKMTYTDDPKIIIGTGNAEEQIKLALDDLRRADAQLSDKPKQQKQIESIESELEHLIDDLK